MDIDSWMKVHKTNFGSSFEQLFAVKVLAKVNELDLNTVSTQHQFKDLDGKNRYCDFAIQEGSIKIAIEIDGYDKRNTGQGMSYDDFVDWQRRQAALTACGWYVLRFANRDVSNEPTRCKHYIELLLRDQRSKIQHQASLAQDIERLSNQLKIFQSKAGAAEQASNLQQEIGILKKQLKLAQNSKPLTSSDKIELEKMVARLEQEKQELKVEHDKIKEENERLESQKQALDGENNTMKTTIWAFATIISILILAGVYVFSGTSNVQQAKPNVEPACDSSIDWRLAKNYVGQRVAVRGTVAEYRYLMNGKGRPTWINLGAKYPVKDRLSVVVWDDDRSKFGRALSDNLVNRQICVVGVINLYDGTPQITLEWPRDLVFQ